MDWTLPFNDALQPVHANAYIAQELCAEYDALDPVVDHAILLKAIPQIFTAVANALKERRSAAVEGLSDSLNALTMDDDAMETN